ncbi:MAG: respiratory nitrate reductase subunit gamma, partial [Thermoanaerobaculia bacterium]
MNAQPFQSLVLVGLPYAAIVVFVAGLVWRYQSRFTITSRSSQIMESRALVWGSIPFHLGIIILFVAHLVPLVAPRWWQGLMADRRALLAVETAGLAAAVLCLLGLIVLFVRRTVSRDVRPGSTLVDLVVLAILIAQVILGLGVATMYRWGAVWSAGTTTPYLWSIFTLRPDPALLLGMPVLLHLHVAGAWILLAL